MELKEEEIDQNLQNIIDAAVSHQAASSPSQESDELPATITADELIFREIDIDEPDMDLFVAVNDDMPDASDARDFAYTADVGHIADVADTANIEYIAFAEYDAEVEVEDAVEAGDDAETEDDAAAEYVTESEDDSEDDMDADDAAAAELVDGVEYITYADDADNDTKAGKSANTEQSLFISNAYNPEGRLIFLSRTLSGLVDLFLIALFTVIFLGMADYFTNAPILNSVSVISFTTLFLMIYFLYSIFFIGTNSQTIGMIMTDLRVVSMNENTLSMSQVVRRNATFLVSLFGLGIGLLAGVFSRKCLCLHDRLSKTSVVRVLEKPEDADI